MLIRIKRIAKKHDYTIGNMYINGEYFCDTLEPTDRGLKQADSLSDIKKNKVKGKTAIPTGLYYILLNYSPKFKKILPYIDNVKGFSGIRIHSGNTADDTEGCILVGYNTVVGKVTNSKDTLSKLIGKMYKQEINLVID